MYSSKTLHVKKYSLFTFPLKPYQQYKRRQRKIGPTHPIHSTKHLHNDVKDDDKYDEDNDKNTNNKNIMTLFSPSSKVNYQYSFDDKYKKEEFLCSGSWSQVFRGSLHSNPAQKVAIKQIRKSKDEKIARQIQREKDIHSQLKHINIIELNETFEDEYYIYLVMEFSQQGDLFDKLEEEKYFSERQTVKYMVEICNGLNYCHNLNIIHRDIKLENILIGNDGHVKISDFGWAIQTQSLCNSFCGTLEFLPPEILKGESYGHQCDIWSLGIMMYEMLCGTNPFGNRSSNDSECFWMLVTKQIINDEPDLNSSFLSLNARDLLKKMLCKNVDNRITIDDILAHSWIIDNK